MHAINVVKIVNFDCVLFLNVAQQPSKGKALSVQIWKRLESEEVGNKGTFMIHVNEVAKPVVKLLSGTESSYGDDSLQMQTLTLEPRLSFRKRAWV